MYLISENKRPFAVVENLAIMRIEQAISEEFNYENVGVDNFEPPKIGESVVVNYDCLSQDEGTKINASIEIESIVYY